MPESTLNKQNVNVVKAASEYMKVHLYNIFTVFFTFYGYITPALTT